MIIIESRWKKRTTKEKKEKWDSFNDTEIEQLRKYKEKGKKDMHDDDEKKSL